MSKPEKNDGPTSEAAVENKGEGKSSTHKCTGPGPANHPGKGILPAPEEDLDQQADDITAGLDEEAIFLSGSATRVQAYQRILEEELKKVEQHEREWIERCGGFADKSDFNKLFFHRHCCVSRWPRGEQIVKWLEVIASKLMYTRRDGQPGFFASWEGWDETACLCAFSEWPKADSIIKCAIRVSQKNPGWCHQVLFCPFCVWMLSLEAYVDAFGPGTGAFNRSRFIFASISWTDSSANQRRAVYRDLNEDDFDLANPDSGLFRAKYSSRPFNADKGEEVYELRALADLQMQAITHVYGKKIKQITGYRAKNEVAVTLDRTNRFLPNLHAILTTRDPGQHLADEMYDFAEMGLEKLKEMRLVRRSIQPAVLLMLINSDENLKRCLKYTDKPIDLLDAWRKATNRPEALNGKGMMKASYSGMMMESILRLFQEADDALPKPRSKAAGTMRFGVKAFVGVESEKHRAWREAQAKKAQDRRERIIAEIKTQWPDPKDQREQIRRRLGKKKKPPISPLDE